jgi:hypothetical protein
MERNIGFVALASERMWAYKTNICYMWFPFLCLRDEHFGTQVWLLVSFG